MQLLQHKSWIVIASLSTWMSGCMLGPDFHSPASPSVKSYTKKPVKDVVYGKSLPGEWWTLFHSKELNRLIDQGLANSPTMAAGQATLRQAQETLNAQIGMLMFPQVSADLNGTRQLYSYAGLGSGNNSAMFNLFNAGVNVSYTLDLFGASRRQLESLAAQVDYQRYQLIGTYLTLTSNIATTVVTIAELQAQIDATKQLVGAISGQLMIIEKQYHLGGASYEDVLSQQTLLATTRTLIPPLEKKLSQSRHALAVLVGAFPSEGPVPTVTLAELHLPHQLPVSLPSCLVRQRPDVQGQEALLHQASAQIGVATANLFPTLTLTGNYGWSAGVPSQLFGTVSNTWAYGAGITQSVFNGGGLMAQRRAAIAAYDAAFAQYKQTVLLAFQNVADSLRAIQEDTAAYRNYVLAETSAKKTYQMTKGQYRLGAVSYLTFLNAEEKYQQAVINRIQAQAARYTDTVALFQSLGGGWWNR